MYAPGIAFVRSYLLCYVDAMDRGLLSTLSCARTHTHTKKEITHSLIHIPPPLYLRHQRHHYHGCCHLKMVISAAVDFSSSTWMKSTITNGAKKGMMSTCVLLSLFRKINDMPLSCVSFDLTLFISLAICPPHSRNPTQF